MNRQRPVFILFTLSLAILSTPAFADQSVEAGETLTLKEDLVLTGTDFLDIKGLPNSRCTLIGNGHRIRTQGQWTGSVRIHHCDIRQLGAAAKLTEDGRRIGMEFPAIDLTITGKG